MPRRHPRPPEDITALADTLRPRWKPALGIEPWLRRNVRMLTRLVRDERWTWEDIGRALTEAGIVYDTGRPWTRKGLTDKISAARKAVEEQRQKQRQVAQSEPAALPEQASALVPQPAIEQLAPEMPDPVEAERERLRAKFGTGSTLRNSKSAAPPPAAQPVAPPEQPPQRNEQEIKDMIARALGKPGTPKT